jgi:AraC-like DNA-binding protein
MRIPLQPTAAAITQALREGLEERRSLSVEAIAHRLSCSPSTVHRRLRRRGTTFVAQRRAVQLHLALGLITSGYAPSVAARRVGVSSDHLGVMMRKTYGLGPRQLGEIARLADDLRQSPRTRQELVAYGRKDVRLQRLLEPIGPGHPLLDWARELVVLGNHPEFYEHEFLQKLREEESRQRVRAQHRFDAEMVAGLCEEERLTAADDGELLAFSAEQARLNMQWRSRQLRHARRNLRVYSQGK